MEVPSRKHQGSLLKGNHSVESMRPSRGDTDVIVSSGKYSGQGSTGKTTKKNQHPSTSKYGCEDDSCLFDPLSKQVRSVSIKLFLYSTGDLSTPSVSFHGPSEMGKFKFHFQQNKHIYIISRRSNLESLSLCTFTCSTSSNSNSC